MPRRLRVGHEAARTNLVDAKPNIGPANVGQGDFVSAGKEIWLIPEDGSVAVSFSLTPPTRLECCEA